MLFSILAVVILWCAPVILSAYTCIYALYRNLMFDVSTRKATASVDPCAGTHYYCYYHYFVLLQCGTLPATTIVLHYMRACVSTKRFSFDVISYITQTHWSLFFYLTLVLPLRPFADDFICARSIFLMNLIAIFFLFRSSFRKCFNRRNRVYYFRLSWNTFHIHLDVRVFVQLEPRHRCQELCFIQKPVHCDFSYETWESNERTEEKCSNGQGQNIIIKVCSFLAGHRIWCVCMQQ